MTDESQSALRKLYLIHKWLIPLMLFVVICTSVYVAADYFGLSKNDRIFGFMAALSYAMYRWAIAPVFRLKMPDGTYYYLGRKKGDQLNNDSTLYIEPASYEREFSYAKDKQITNMGLGFFMIGLGYFL